MLRRTPPSRFRIPSKNAATCAKSFDSGSMLGGEAFAEPLLPYRAEHCCLLDSDFQHVASEVRFDSMSAVVGEQVRVTRTTAYVPASLT